MARPRPTPPGRRVVRAAGALVWRLSEDASTYPGTQTPRQRGDIEVLLVHRPKYDDWSWPKGKMERGESLRACATREVEEETAVAARLEAPLSTQRYQLGTNATKEVYYWAARAQLEECALSARAPVQPAPTSEIDRARWVKPNKALHLLTRRGDRRLLSELLTRLDERQLDTRTLVVLRHAKAVKRAEWKQGEAARPLARQGVHQVGQLTGILSAYGVANLVSSPWRRCLATVGPYASLTGANMSVRSELTETAAGEDPDGFRSLIATLVHQATAPTLLCVHRPTLPPLLGQLALLTPNSLTRQLPQQDPYLRTAEALVAHMVEGEDGNPQIVALETARP